MKKAKSQGGSSSSSSHSFNNKNGFQYQIENDNTNDTDATIEDQVHMTSSGYADMLLIWLGRRLLCRCLVMISMEVKIVEDVTRVLDSFGFHPVIGMSVLIEKSFITVPEERIVMHDLIQEMGRQIVGESFSNSKLWKLEQIHDFPKKNRERKIIEAISVQCQVPKQGVSVDVFKSMKSLRLLNVYREFTSFEPTLLPDELQWIC
ncbi:TMV resistance protein N-like protein [Tanacetum coccineum]